jgi:hypothetical protein
MEFKSIEDVIKLDIEQKNVLIIGCPASGKTYLSSKFNTEHLKIHTDDYLIFGWRQGMYEALKAIKAANTFTLVEGVHGYRLLRKGVELDCYYPDVVIQLIISEERMMKTYINERDRNKIKYLRSFNDTYNKILLEYFSLKNKHRPEWIKLLNQY